MEKAAEAATSGRSAEARIDALGRWAAAAAGSLARSLRALPSRAGFTPVAAGLGLVAVGWVWERDSGWGLPLMIAGLVALAAGTFGSRLSGSLSLSWGREGTHFELRGEVAPRPTRLPAPDSAERSEVSGQHLPAIATARPQGAESEEIEGSAETIEFDADPSSFARRAAG